MAEHNQDNIEIACGQPDALGRPCLLSHTHNRWGTEHAGWQTRESVRTKTGVPPAVLITRLDERAVLPVRMHEGDAGWDLYCLDDVIIEAGDFVDVHTGVAIAMPDTMWARITGRSSTVRNHNLLIVEAVIDSSWRGELFFGVRSLADGPRYILKGTRLAQVIFHQHVPMRFEEVERLPDGERGSCGFGSTGV